MNSPYLIGLFATLLVLTGCQSGKNINLDAKDKSGAVLIGVEVLPPQDQDYELVLTGFDKLHNKPLGYFSGTRTWLGKGVAHPNPTCIDNVCYLQSQMPPGDYIIFDLVLANSPSIFGRGGLLTDGRLVTKRDMSKSTYLFHVEAGKVTYAGNYIVYANMDHVNPRFPMIRTVDGKPGENGETEPSLTYKMDVDAARRALKAFKGVNADMIFREPEPVTFEP